MYVMNGIAYADEAAPLIKVNGIRALKNHRLWLRFSTGEIKIFDFKPLLQEPAFAPLVDEAVFANVYIDFGVPVWNNGEIDIAPDVLHKNGVLADNADT